MLNRSWFLTFIAALTAVVVTGCNKGPGITTYPVTGTVTYNGKPVSGATVAYMSKNPDAPKSTGTTDAEGKFSLSTYLGPRQILKGAVADDYRVAIFKEAAPDVASNPSAMENMSFEERQNEMKRRMTQFSGEIPGAAGKAAGMPAAPPKPKAEIPEKYARPETSGLTATVVSGENEPVEFKLID